MSNLTIENLSGINSGAAIDSRYGIESQAPVSERKILEEMRRNGLESPKEAESGTFSGMLTDSLHKVNQYQSEADSAIKNLVAGRTKNIHETLLAVERADSSLKLMMQVRNKILDAYKEIMRMQV